MPSNNAGAGANSCRDKVVHHLKERHLNGFENGSTIEEILKETKQSEVPKETIEWLKMEDLALNLSIETMPGDTYRFSPVYSVKDNHDVDELFYCHDVAGSSPTVVPSSVFFLVRFFEWQ